MKCVWSSLRVGTGKAFSSGYDIGSIPTDIPTNMSLEEIKFIKSNNPLELAMKSVEAISLSHHCHDERLCLWRRAQPGHVLRHEDCAVRYQCGHAAGKAGAGLPPRGPQAVHRCGGHGKDP